MKEATTLTVGMQRFLFQTSVTRQPVVGSAPLVLQNKGAIRAGKPIVVMCLFSFFSLFFSLFSLTTGLMCYRMDLCLLAFSYEVSPLPSPALNCEPVEESSQGRQTVTPKR